MPKLKTRRSVAKRFRITGRGRVKHSRSNRSHLLSGKDRNRKRRLRRPDMLNRTDQERVKRLLPWQG